MAVSLSSAIEFSMQGRSISSQSRRGIESSSANARTAMEAHPIAHCLSVSVHDRFSVDGITIVSRKFIQQSIQWVVNQTARSRSRKCKTVINYGSDLPHL
jgi:hypothetical protein